MEQSRVPLTLRFGSFAFDEANARLVADGTPIGLAPKAFNLLAELLHNAGQLVTKDALLDAVWGHRHVSESVLKTTISELRAALRDDAKNPRWVETASRRGYRFIGAIEDAAPAAELVIPSQVVDESADLIGRHALFARLSTNWARAADGQRRICFVAGEAGIGKTSLIDAFAQGLCDVTVAHGQCIERVGVGEPYLPVLEALAALARVDTSLVPLLRRVAPMWLLQLPWLVEREEQERLQAVLASATQDRMIREFCELIEQWTATRTLLLVTEDLHWCDEATVLLIDHVARRRAPARLMWLASYRTPELVADDHPLNGLRHELRARRLCDELLLEPFSEAELAAYLAIHRPEFASNEDNVRRLHQQTDGLPLFVVNAVEELAMPASLSASSDEWSVPDSLAGMIERQRARLAPEVASLLAAAAVCGVEFECSLVAEMLGRDASLVASQCDELARRQAWLASAELGTLADGTLDARFVFRHALYRHALYQHLSPPERASLHRRAAAAIQLNRGGELGTLGALLALHHERGLDALSAMGAYAAAGQRALGRFAPREALLLADRGLALTEQAIDGEPRWEAELALQHLRGQALAQSTGVSTPAGRAAFRRCAELIEMLPPTLTRAWVMTGLVWMFFACGEYREVDALAQRLRAVGDTFDNGQMRAAAAVAQALPKLQRGQLSESLVLLQEAFAFAEAPGAASMPGAAMHDPVTTAFGVGAIAHAFRGDGELAQQWADQAVSRAARLGQPMSRAIAARCAVMVAVRFGRPQAVLACIEGLRLLMHEYGLSQPEGASLALLGWAHAQLGDAAQGLREAEEGSAAHEAAGAWFESTCLRRLAAEAALAAGDLAAARRHIAEGLAIAARIGEALHLPDLWLTRSALLSSEGDSNGARTAAQTAADLACESGGLVAELTSRLVLCELPGNGAPDLESLRQARLRWRDGTHWPVLARIDELLHVAS